MVDYTPLDRGFDKLKYAGSKFDGKMLFAFTTSKEYAYLRFNRCFASQDADNKTDGMVVSKILDTIFENFTNSKTLIIDVLDNIGNNYEFAFEVANRFVEKKSIGMIMQTCNGGYEDFGESETSYLEPKGNPNFLKPVIVLTNDKTSSEETYLL